MAKTRIPVKVIKTLNNDLVMAEIIKTTSPEMSQSSGNVYHDLIRSITSQQLSVRVAEVIYARFLSLYDDMEPAAEILVNADHEALRKVGFSNQKARYVRNVAEYFTEQDPDYTYWQQYSDDEVIEMLTTIKGVGKWTVQMILMFTLERPDVFPVDDLGIQMGMKHFYQLEEEKKELKQKILQISESWKPYRTYASRYIWAAKDKKK